MTKLNESVEKNCAVLNADPFLALQGLPRAYSQKDIKKVYRTLILKYHPDKNQDCDTSCIFTTIQVAYENLMQIDHHQQSTEGVAEPRPSQPKSNQRHRHSTQRHAPSPQRQKRAAPAIPREEDYYSGASGRSSAGRGGQSGDVYGMTSEQIRRALWALGGGGKGCREEELACCSREELVRRYLNDRARAFSTGCNESQWQQKVAESLRKERKREREADLQKAQRGEQKGCGQRAEEEADLHRQERATRMKRELPLMSIAELRRMMNTWYHAAACMPYFMYYCVLRCMSYFTDCIHIPSLCCCCC